ncbi:MAG TPA: TetR/AcrR family transcriptional regulator [Dehalococcoidia bacterium]|jgi:AcrR family transcriptional regulator|nr:TetR/AcrR family transcriptional regulator [Dehalococcoidia bacterium]
MPKLKPEELETRRREIIDAARACFLKSGFHKTTTDEICREANITPGGLYHYFGSKEELIASVIDRSAETAVERMRSLIADSMNAESAFRQVGSIFFQTMQDGEIDNATRLELEIWVEGLKNDKLLEKSKKAWAMRMKWLEALVARGITEGIYDAEVVEPRAMASLLIAIWLGLRMGRLMGEEFDLSGALRSFAMMHAGRLTPNMPALAMPK